VAFESTDFADAVPLWRGFHHVALVTPDLDATIRFYGDVLGMRVGEVVSATERQGRHCFIKPCDTVETWGLHFFERPDDGHNEPRRGFEHAVPGQQRAIAGSCLGAVVRGMPRRIASGYNRVRWRARSG
jgi:catechol 2,3-dioxygenase-like lactoylglutathione lyase family enzyme